MITRSRVKMEHAATELESLTRDREAVENRA